MSKDLKGYLKNNKTNKIDNKKAHDIASQLSQKNSNELNADFANMLARSKANGTFNKGEMLEMLSSIKSSMSQSEFDRIKSIISSL